ncbi:ATP-binding cassette sub-family A member 3 isoform X2 [Drosophila miranda]|uniref:ATP-binding cassette sub-family A member 3 isoform X1 n=1 Tax=Drosophila miranda TaxID=7229 RepID=UPI00143F9724|nr:ATP-binding cassette sub-family A member 3 isoform X1 [Drosophila miranda]XP_033249489.1 ATP-binding cassette sub-family A member 3 isoform X2 [Drosophila miranda]
MANEEEVPKVLSCQRKLLLILWKNLCVLFGRKCQLACLIIFSLAIPLVPFLIGAKRTIRADFQPKLDEGIILLFSPQNKIFELLVRGLSFPGTHQYHVQGFVDASAMEEDLTKNYWYRGAFGIEFPDEWADISEFPQNFRFALRFPASKIKHFHTNLLISLHEVDEYYGKSGFLYLQTEISFHYLQKKNSSQTLLRPKLKGIYENQFLLSVSYFFIFLMCVFLLPFTMDVKSIVEEKELQLKDMLNIFDVSHSLQWLAWYVKSMIVLFIISLIITIFWTVIPMGVSPVKNKPILCYTDWSVFLFYLLVCSHSFICFGFLVSSFCARSNWSAIIAILLFIASSLPYFVTNKDSTGTLLNILCSICVVSAMNMVMDRIVVWERAYLGLQWSNMFNTSWLRDSISVGAILLIMLLSSLISILICLYMERVRPGEFGTPQPWNFPCTKHFWCPSKYMRRILSPPGLFTVRPNDEERPSSVPSSSKFIDANAKGKTSGVQIKNLSKSFGKRQVVAGLTFDLFENEIMVLLGHNGAGKTTTIQMLTGTIAPSSGTAVINGYDIQTERPQARQSLSICPQRSVFFKGLSAASHLRLYSRLRGLKGAAVKQEVNSYLQKLSLKEKANLPAQLLSGGTQRRLALACALCGNVKVLFCDEPSSGLDPNSRLELWKLLLDEKQGRTILLTTHQMDEGEVLADRIAIISDGRLRCLGTLAFLKKQNETSYLLTCEKGPNCNVSRLTQLIAAHVPYTRPHSNIGSDVSYRLPHRFLGSFGSLFKDLEQQKEQLDVVGFGLSSTSLAEIFMSHGAEDLGSGGRTTGGGGSDEQSQSQEQSRHPNRCLRYLSQWEAMLLKKLLYTYDRKWMFLVILLVPIVIYFVTLLRRLSDSSLLARLPLTIADYKSEDVKVILQLTSDTHPLRNIANAYQELAQQYCTVERTTQNVVDYIGPGQETPERIYAMKSSLIAAATIDQEMVVWSRNDLFVHSAPISLNLVFNAMAKAMVGPEASIEVTNAPYDMPTKEQTIEEVAKPIVAGGFIIIYLCIVLAIFAILVSQEKGTQIRMQQQVSGVNMTTYWLSHFITDLVLYFLISMVLTLAVREVCHPKEMLSILMIIGVAGLPFTYMLACLFGDSGSAVMIITNINIVFGIGFAIMMPLFAATSYRLTFNVIAWVAYLFPVFTAVYAVANCITRFTYCSDSQFEIDNYSECTPVKTAMFTYCACRDMWYWVEVWYLLITGIIYLLLLIFGECSTTLWYGIKYIICRRKENATSNDEDVAAAAEMISKMSIKDRKEHALVVNKVSKRFFRTSAVRGISFSIKPGVCFGLLGANGAGKTTTFKMIVGDIAMTRGSIHVKGFSIKSSPTAARMEMGYCPQHDTLFDFCTGRQTLRIFLLLRGTPRNLLRKASEKLASDYGFLAHLDNKVKDYSGGTKRKLNAAVAGEGSSLICLDEPSSGIDPASRRHVWNVLSSLRDSGKAVLLSSHSMEEVEALCTELAIMVDGQIHCLGSQQRIKNKFAQCLVLKLHVETSLESMASTIQKIKNQMELDYPKASLKEEFGGRLTYHIPTAKLRWSSVFSYVERNHSPWQLADYSLTQPSLEDVFLDIAKKKTEEKNQQKNPNRQPGNSATNKGSSNSDQDIGSVVVKNNGRTSRGTNT